MNTIEISKKSTKTLFDLFKKSYSTIVDDLINIENEFNINIHVLGTIFFKYQESFRYYHNVEHLNKLFHHINYLHDNFPKEFTIDLKLLALFHDAICDPKSLTNEKDSAELFKQTILKSCKLKNINDHPKGDRLMSIYEAILATQNHESVNDLSRVFNYMDMFVISDYPMDMLFEYEEQIFQEYQFLPYDEYKKIRCQVLENLNKDYKRTEINNLIDYVRQRKIRVGIYAGSFKPFHIGHNDILKKARKMFDKIIIARGINPTKPDIDKFETDLEKLFPYLETTTFETYSYDYANSLREKGIEPFLIKGLRNDDDLKLEMIQDKYNEEIRQLRIENGAGRLEPILTVNIFSDEKYSHISSSSIRIMENFESGSAKNLIYHA